MQFSVEPQRHSPVPWPLRAGAWCVLSAIWGSLCYLWWWTWTSDVADLGGAEIFAIYSLVSVRDGRALYPPVLEPPFSITQYSPLLYLVADAGNRILQLTSENVAAVAAVARCTATLAWLGVVALVLFVWRRLNFGWLPACGAATFTLVGAGHFPYQARPDSLEVLCSASAVVLLWQFGEKTGRKAGAAIFVAGMLGCLAAFAKQNGVITCAFAVVAGWTYARASVPLLFAGGFALACSVTFLPMFLHYEWTLKNHLVDGVDNGVDLLWALQMAYLPVLQRAPFLLAVGIALAAQGIGDGKARGRRTLSWIALVTCVAHTVAALKFGSAENYYMEFGVLTTLLFGVELASGRLGAPRPWLAVGFTALTITAFLQLSDYAVALWKGKRLHGGDIAPLVAELEKRFAQHPDAYVAAADTRLPLLFPRRAAVGQLLLVTLMHQRGLFDYRPYFELVDSGRLRYHVVDVRGGPVERVYSDHSNFEFPLRDFRPVGVFGTFALLENPRAKP